MSKVSRKYVGVYGSVAIEKRFCQSCQQLAFVLGGELQCCDRKVVGSATKWKKEIVGDGDRKHVPKAWKDEQLEAQENRCFYCGLTFGSIVFRGARTMSLQVQWDHFVPFALSENHSKYNFVAACQVCNRIKSDLVFQSSGEAVTYVRERREAKGYL